MERIASRRTITVRFIILMIFVSVLWADGAPCQSAVQERIVILFTHDLHSFFLPRRVAQAGGRPIERGGYAKMLTLIRGIRSQEGDRTLLVDSGDFSMGTLFHTLYMTEAAELRLMAAMGYDAMTLGNHDFDFRLSGLAKTLRVARAKTETRPLMVASNVVFSPDGVGDSDLRDAFREYPVIPYAVVKRGGIRIGLFGILGKDAQTDTPFAKPVTFADPIETSKRMVDHLKNNEQVDLIICLSHSGTSQDKTHSEDEELARQCPGIDVIVSGHTHTVLAQPIVIGKTVIVSSGSYGEYLGRLAIDYRKEAGAAVTGYEIIPVAGEIQDTPMLAGQIAGFKRDVERDYLSSYGYRFDQALAESGFDMETLGAAYARPQETGIGDMITDAYRTAVRKAEGAAYEHVHVAVEPLGLIRDSILKGAITVDDLFRVLSLGLGVDGKPGYPLVSYYIRGKELKDLLEVETTVATIKRDAHLQLSGVRFSFNPHRIPFDRVTAMAVLNAAGAYEPVEPEKLYRICLNYYTAQMVDYVRTASHGLLSVTPRDREGRLVTDTKQGIIDSDLLTPGTQEIKEWVALAAYMKSFPDIDGNGIPEIPARYRQPEGRFSAAPSWNPVRIIAGGNGITYGFLGIAFAVIALAGILVYVGIRFIRRRLHTA